MPVAPIPAGYHTLTPYLIVRGAARAMEFYTRAFGARELFRVAQDNGVIGHAEMQIGDSRIMLADEFPQMGAQSPEALGGSPVFLLMYVADVDSLTAQAVAAGAELVRPLANQFYGDRSCVVRDPFGHSWSLSTHIEDVPPEEIAVRAKAHHKG